MAALRLLLFAEGASFLAASLVHRGVLVGGYEHDKAAVAETVIGAVLVGGALLAWLRPARARPVAIAVQAFALLGTCVGVAMIAIGVGPRTAPDLAYHASILTVLLAGLVLAARGGRRGAAAAAGQGARS
jgi:hypothetical protein